jgi:inner membrane transporter RhtA
MVSLLPATATVIGVLILAQIPSAAELAGVALVVAAIAAHREASGEVPEPDAQTMAA